MRGILIAVGMITKYGAGLCLFFFWFVSMTKRLGFCGFVLALIFSPGIVIFPIIYWIVEGVFPVTYFVIWGLGILGMIIAGLAMPD